MKATDGKQTQYVIQYLRAIAAALVVFHHVSFQVVGAVGEPFFLKDHPDLTAFGAAGVDIFFVISGFIIFYTMTEQTGARSSANFLWHRFVRVVPLYWFWTSVLVAAIASRVALANTKLDLGWLFASYALLPYEHRPGEFHPILDQGWTLSFEMYFYAVVAVLIVVLPIRRRLAGLALLLVVVQAFSLAAPVPAAWNQWLGSFLIYEFLAGAAIACFFRFGWGAWETRQNPKLGGLLIAAGAAGFILPLLFGLSSIPRILAWGLPSALLVLGSVFLNRVPTFLVERTLFRLGSASYSLYLSHVLFAVTLGGLMKRGYLQFIEPNAMIVGSTILIIVAGSIPYWLVEKPLLKLFRRKRQPPYSTSAAAGVS